MGKRTSVYLTDSLAEGVDASGLGLAEIVRRGLGATGHDEGVARDAAQRAAEAIAADLREIVRSEVKSALRDIQGGAW
jgi:hypothetical protein